jgi:hypothetical protein
MKIIMIMRKVFKCFKMIRSIEKINGLNLLITC